MGWWGPGQGKETRESISNNGQARSILCFHILDTKGLLPSVSFTLIVAGEGRVGAWRGPCEKKCDAQETWRGICVRLRHLGTKPSEY